MNGFTNSRAATLGRSVLAGSLLMLTGVARGEESAGVVQASDKNVIFMPIDGTYCPPTVNCPPSWSPGLMPVPSRIPQQPAPFPQSAQPQRPTPALPQADAQSPTPAPFAPSTNPGQFPQQSPTAAQTSFGPPGNALTAATAPQSVAPNMVGDFFGGISSDPIILPGAVVDQAIFLQPGVNPLLDHYRGLTSTGIGTFDTDTLVYLATTNGQPAGVLPTQLPPQLLQQFDGTLFVGDPATLGLVTGAGPFIAVDTGTTGDVTTQAPLPAALLLNEPIFNIHDALLIFVPSPGAGGGVGRQKIAENTSPIPRDRVFINHSTFSGVPLTQKGINVYRFSPGIEMAFFEQRFSIEVRLPFASTIDSDISTGGGSTDTESTQLGNIVGTLKALVRRTPTSAVAVGVSVTAPTANDLSVIDLTGAPLLSIENQSTHLMPFIGGTHTRGKLFSQWYVQGDIDATGSDVQLRNLNTGTFGDAGQMQDATFLYLSASFGYWIYQNGHRSTSFTSSPGREVKRTIYTGGDGITGFAPLVEVHYNRSLQASDTITAGPVQLQSFSDFELTNLVVGGILTFGTGGSITAAWGTPVLGRDDQQFAHEARLTFDYEY